MRRFRSLAVTLLLLASVTTLVSAKGVTSRIAIRGGHLADTIEIVDPVLAQGFNVWAGPGTFMNDIEGTEGFIVDWASGPVAEPADTRAQFLVSFFVRFPNAREERLAYVVVYRSGSSGGFVYLPGRRDEWYGLNTRSIFRAREGQWFRATTEWQDLVAPLLAQPGPVF